MMISKRKFPSARILTLLILVLSTAYLTACTAFVRCEMDIENQSLETMLDATIPCLLDKYDVPGAAVAIARNGKLYYSNGWGKLRAGKDTPVNVQTLFPAASLTKPVFAYGALLLVRDGRLDLDRSLSDYLDEPYIEDDERLTKITARMVLSHTSGFPNWRPGFWTGSPKPLKILFEPGTNFKYSGEGYNYLQRVVEKITGRPLDIYMKDTVFDPLGMRNSYFVWDEAMESVIVTPHGRWGQTADKRQWRPEKPMGAATLFTTIEDYAKFLAAILLTADQAKQTATATQILSPKTLEKMLEPQIEIDPPLAWSLGWGLEKHEDDWYFWQWGDNPGIKHFVAGSRSRKLAVVVFTNGQNGKEVYRPIIKAVLSVKLNALDNI
jgi:CubicO group peptidase (beta-lactamase class C family)